MCNEPTYNKIYPLLSHALHEVVFIQNSLKYILQSVDSM